MGPALLLACSSMGSAGKGESFDKDPQNLAKPVSSDPPQLSSREPEKGWNWVLLSAVEKAAVCFFFLLPSFVFSPFALKKLLIIISVQFEMQA